MHCPRCQNELLDEIDRNGVTVDRCAKCRGIWLDRGELEKLVARATAEIEGAAPVRGVPWPGQHSRDFDREPPSSRRSHPGQHRKRSFWHELLD